MARPIKTEHRPYIERIKEAAEAEERARERAAAQVRAVVAEARNTTNRAIVEAVKQGATKEAIRNVLGISYTTLYVRLQEYDALHGALREPTKEDEPEVVVTPAVTVVTDDVSHTVILDRFTHPDVGTELSGRVVFDLDGEMKVADPHLADLSDPLWFDKLWATKEVQDGLDA